MKKQKSLQILTFFDFFSNLIQAVINYCFTNCEICSIKITGCIYLSIYERILIKPKGKEAKTGSGIMLPEKAIKRPNIGTVVSCGGGSTHNPMLVSPGDIVLFNRYAGMEINYSGELHYVIMANELIAILETEDEVQLDEYA